MSSDSEEYLLHLREAVTTISELRRERDALLQDQKEPIAVIGLGCRFPGGGTDPERFWQSLRQGVDAVREIPKERWPSNLKPPSAAAARWAGLLDQVDQFDADFFQISPREAESIDPQQRLVLEVSWEALEDAGLLPKQLFGSRTGVFMGALNLDYRDWVMSGYPKSLDVYGATGCSLSAIAGRISYVLGLQGPCAAIDTACSASLVAVHQACRSLRNKECSLALAGGVNLILSPITMEVGARAQALSPDGRCKTFDALANGTVRGEGCGVAVLKRLSDALADGDRIWAIIRGSATNQDGRSGGFTAPNAVSQEALLRQALDDAGVSPARVGYIEAHGTGTSLGDPIEAEAIKEVLGEPRPDGSPCVLGSVKTNIGHTEAAAGIAGIVKTVLSLKHGLIPRHLNFRNLNPRISFSETPFVIPLEEKVWVRGPNPRIAGVSSFGLTGVNAHVVLEEAPVPATASDSENFEHLLTLSGKTEAALHALAKKYVTFLEQPDSEEKATFGDIAYTANARRSHHQYRLAVAGASTKEWAQALSAYGQGQGADKVAVGRAPSGRPPKLAFVYSGLGSQWFGMGRQLFHSESVFRETLQECDAAIHKETGRSILQALLSDELRLWLGRPDLIQPVLFSIQIALSRLWRFWGIVPDAVIGTSMGEAAAAHACGALSLEDAIRIVCRRGPLIQTVSGQGAMAVVELGFSQAQHLANDYEGRLTIAASNGPFTTLLSGNPEVLERVLTRLQTQGIFCRMLPGANAASHSPQMEVLKEPLLAALAEVNPGAPQLAMFSTVTQGEVTPGMLNAAYWFRNLRQPILFWPTILQMRERQYEVFVEVSPHPVLLSSLRDGLQTLNKGGVALGTLKRELSERSCMLEALGKLHVLGCNVDWPRLHVTGRRCVSLPSYPWQRERFWVHDVVTSQPQTEGRQRESQANQHPLLGRYFSLSNQPSAHYFEQRISLEELPYLRDHKLQGEAIFPGMGYLEMGLAAVKQLHADATVILEQVRFEQMLVLHEKEEPLIQLALTADRTDGGDFQISSQKQGKWVRHALGSLRWVTASQRSIIDSIPESPREIQRRCPVHRTKAEHYQRIRELGGSLGPSFQGVEELWLGEREILARVVAPPQLVAQMSRYQVHPAWLDACFHISFSALCITGTDIFVPVAVERLEIYRAVEEPVFVHASILFDEHSIQLDVLAWTDDGRPVLRAKGVIAQRVAAQSFPKADGDPQAAWRYEVRWQKKPRERAAPQGTSEPGDWLVFTDQAGVGSAVLAALRQDGARCIEVGVGDNYRRLGAGRYQIEPTDPQGYRTLLREVFSKGGSCRGIIHLWSLDGPAMEIDSPQGLEAAQRRGSRSGLELIQAVLRSGWRELPRLWLVTRGTQDITEADSHISVAEAPLWSLGQTLALEHPELPCTRIDISTATRPAEIGSLVEEIRLGTQEEQLGLREEERYVARLTRGTFSQLSQAAKPSCKEDGSYLISGGLSGLGLATAKWLAHLGAKHLVLIARSVPSEAAKEVIKHLEAAKVQVITAQVDVANFQDVADLLSHFGRNWPALRGIIHSATVLDDGIILEQSWERFLRVMAPKMQGAWNLHLFSASQPLDFFICYSSAASLLGAPGQANYVAANAFLDALSHYRRRKGQCALSINWGLFSGIGMALTRGEQISTRGVKPLTADEGSQILARLLGDSSAQVGVMRLDISKWASFFPMLQSSSYFSELLGEQPIPKTGAVPKPELQKLFLATSDKERQQQLEECLKAEVSQILRLALEKIDAEVPLVNLGLDSLMAVELRNRLDAEFRVSVQISFLLRGATIASLGASLLEQLFASSASHDDLEAVEEGSV